MLKSGYLDFLTNVHRDIHDSGLTVREVASRMGLAYSTLAGKLDPDNEDKRLSALEYFEQILPMLTIRNSLIHAVASLGYALSHPLPDGTEEDGQPASAKGVVDAMLRNSLGLAIRNGDFERGLGEAIAHGLIDDHERQKLCALLDSLCTYAATMRRQLAK